MIRGARNPFENEIYFSGRVFIRKMSYARHIPQVRGTEMPTSGDLKSGDCLFFTTPRKIDPAPNGNDLGHYMTSYMMYILSKFEIIVLMLEIIFVND